MRKHKKLKKCTLTRLLALSVLLAALEGGLGSCGIETYKYLGPVESGIPMLLNTTAYITLPGGQPNYFRYFIIYYRIYISDLPVPGVVDPGILAQINPTLLTDYNYFNTYTNTTNTVVPTTMGTIFSGRKYFSLELENDSIERILSSAGGGVVTLDFAANAQFKPSLVLGDLRVPEQPSNPYQRRQLSRNMRNDNNPYANNYYFVNSDDVNNGAHISSDSSNINQDVQNNQNASGQKYTYVSMYILSYGLDDSNFTNIYSIPTFIGIFRMPDA
ncbi:MAG: hypothetical protein LBK63_14650 [Treponema sp.]|jgi:hypothetical protein|nr:hypothetical protein [Treponema sp.]